MEPGWLDTPATTKRMITSNHVALDKAHLTPQFWLIWAVLCLNVSAGIGIIGAASPMLQETFGGALFRDHSVGFAQFTDDSENFCRRDRGRIRRALLFVQYWRQVFLGHTVGFYSAARRLISCFLWSAPFVTRSRRLSQG